MITKELLKPLTDKCKDNKCNHKKCKCGHCSQYHIGNNWECCQINIDLTTCICKKVVLN